MNFVRERLGVAPALLAKAFPFYLAFDSGGKILQTGPALRRLCPALVEGSLVADSIALDEPKMAIDYEAIRERAACAFTLETELSPEQSEYLDIIKTSADSLLGLLNDILDTSKIEAGKLELDPVDFRLRELLDCALKPMRIRAAEKGLPLHCEIVGQDIRYGVQNFRRAPVFTASAVAAIALGLGAATAVFSVVDRILFRSLPYPDADRLVALAPAAAPRGDFLKEIRIYAR